MENNKLISEKAKILDKPLENTEQSKYDVSKAKIGQINFVNIIKNEVEDERK